MISRDRAGLDPDSLPAKRWRLLAAHGIELEVWILASEETQWEQAGIRVIGTGGKHFFARVQRALQRKLVNAPDLITTQNPAELGLLGLWLAKRWKCKLEVQDHSGGFDGSGLIDESFSWLRYQLALWVVKRADSIRTVNPQSLSWLLQHVKARAYWLPIVPRQDLREAKRQTIPGRIVSVARLVPVKRLSILIEALALLRKHQPDASLVLVGDGPERTRLEELVADLKIKPFVNFVGQTDPLPWLVQADVFALLSAHEGWGVAAVEAGLVGVPVVMSDTGCARFLEERGNALVLRNVTPETAADALEKLRSKQPKPLMDVLTPESFAEEQVGRWKELCL
jgi:glycosyltransferase involved in cell wall biosynthesis